MSFVSFVLLSALFFSIIIIVLVLLLIFIESLVVKKGDCHLKINDQCMPFVVQSGKSLLTVLSENKIFLPSACGGRGECGVCTCRVTKGGGEILPTETAQIPWRLQKEHYRLACQVKVREDLDILIPAEAFNVKKFECEVISNLNVATFIKELVLRLPPSEPFDFKAGGYIQIDIPAYTMSFRDIDVAPEYRPDWDKFKLWDLKAQNTELIFRAYSMANYPGEKGLVKLNVRIATPPPKDMSLPPGIASSYIYRLKPGDKVMVSGPYGEFFIKDTQKEMIYIGGGAGMAPLRSHLFELFKSRRTTRKVSFWYGARSRREIFYEEDFSALEKEFPNFQHRVALSAPLPEDKWQGDVGFIHQVLYEKYLKNHPDPEGCEYYLCGPGPMIDAVNKMLDSLGVPPEMIAYDNFG